jgi:hypothetical protein
MASVRGCDRTMRIVIHVTRWKIAGRLPGKVYLGSGHARIIIIDLALVVVLLSGHTAKLS